MKTLLLSGAALCCFALTGCGNQGNTVVAPTDNELTEEERQSQEQDDEMREDYESGGDRE